MDTLLGVTKRAVIYTRVSLDKTGDQASTQRQEQACRALIESRGWQLVGVKTDNSISAWSGKQRDGWDAVMAMVAAKQIDVVVSWHIDRMTRSMLDLEQLILLAEEAGVGVATATGDIDLTTDVGRMVARILAAVARAEVERKAARQKLANEQRALAGGPTPGARPFGWNEDRRTHKPAEAAAIRKAARDLLTGVSLATIAREWTEKGYRSGWAERGRGTGTPWKADSVRDVLLNPRVAGRRTYLGEVVKADAYEPILDEATFISITQHLTDPSRRRGKGGPPSALLSSLASCQKCRGTVAAAATRKGVLTYRCRGDYCFNRPRGDVDKFVEGLIFRRLRRPDAAELLWDDDNESAEEIREELAGIERRLNALAVDYAEEIITRDQLTTGTQRLRARRDELESNLESPERSDVLRELIGSDDLPATWERIGLERQRAAVRVLLDIELRPMGQHVRGFHRDFVQYTWR